MSKVLSKHLKELEVVGMGIAESSSSRKYKKKPSLTQEVVHSPDKSTDQLNMEPSDKKGKKKGKSPPKNKSAKKAEKVNTVVCDVKVPIIDHELAAQISEKNIFMERALDKIYSQEYDYKNNGKEFNKELKEIKYDELHSMFRDGLYSSGMGGQYGGNQGGTTP